ncbi:MAG: hypothetical protein K8F62_14215 [Pseudorhodoplanes sp.]|nr:hypothetical protein [Pseudorhodoplanes sp.]
MIVETLYEFCGVARVLFTRIGANLVDRRPIELARRAIESARVLKDGRDGISYLIAAKRNGILTALTDSYEEEIKRQVGASSLEEALAKIGQG